MTESCIECGAGKMDEHACPNARDICSDCCIISMAKEGEIGCGHCEPVCPKCGSSQTKINLNSMDGSPNFIICKECFHGIADLKSRQERKALKRGLKGRIEKQKNSDGWW